MLFWLDFHHAQSIFYKLFRIISEFRHDWSSTSPKEPMLHLSLFPCTGYWLLLASSQAYRLCPGLRHYYKSLYYKSTFPPGVWDPLVTDASWYHHREAQNHFSEHFHFFTFTRSLFLAGGTIFLPLSWMLIPWQSSSDSWKLISVNTIWFHQKKRCLSLYLFLPFLACTCLEQCLKLGITSTSCVCLPL